MEYVDYIIYRTYRTKCIYTTKKTLTRWVELNKIYGFPIEFPLDFGSDIFKRLQSFYLVKENRAILQEVFKKL